jgi:hypothetical protein
VSERRANDNDPKPKGYELGDLEIMPSRRASGAHAAVVAPPPEPAPQAAKASGAKPAPRRGMPRNLTLADGDIGPALELDMGPASPAERRAEPPRAPSPGAPPRVASAAASASAAAVMASFGESSALDDFDQGFAQLPQLEVEKVDRRSGDRVVTKEPVDEALENERKEAEAVHALARFQPAPDGLLASARYAVHVTSRVLALRKERATAIVAQQKRADEHKAALVALGQALMAKAGDKRMEPLRSKIAHVHDERTKLERADQGVEKTREGNQRALSLLQSEAEHLKEELAPYVAAEQEALAVQRKADEEVRRAQAMQKRVEIELRALESAAAVDEKRIDALNAQLEQRVAAVQMLSSGLALATDGLGKARRDLALKRGALDVNEEKQKRLEAESRARELEAEGHKQAANGAFEAALCELSDGARKLKLDALAAEPAAKVRTCESALESAGITVLRFERALKLYDRKAALRGYALMAGVLALAIAALILR